MTITVGKEFCSMVNRPIDAGETPWDALRKFLAAHSSWPVLLVMTRPSVYRRYDASFLNSNNSSFQALRLRKQINLVDQSLSSQTIQHVSDSAVLEDLLLTPATS
jgi:hypothetical protein